MHKAEFPTFIKLKDKDWVMYTEYANGTELELTEKDFWEYGDVVIR